MKVQFEGVKAFVQEKAEQAKQSVNAFAEREDTKAAVAWTKTAINTAADEAVELGKRAARSEMAKDAATGAGIGALVAVPLPIIGPAIGAVLGAGAGVVMNFKSGGNRSTGSPDTKAAPVSTVIDIHKHLLELDDLRQKGILSQEEFDTEKKKILSKEYK